MRLVPLEKLAVRTERIRAKTRSDLSPLTEIGATDFKHPLYKDLNTLSAYAWASGSVLSKKGITPNRLDLVVSTEQLDELEPLLKRLNAKYKIKPRTMTFERMIEVPKTWQVKVYDAVTARALVAMGVPATTEERHSGVMLPRHVEELFNQTMQGNAEARKALMDFLTVWFSSKGNIGKTTFNLYLPQISRTRNGRPATKEYVSKESERAREILSRTLGTRFNVNAGLTSTKGFQPIFFVSHAKAVRLLTINPELLRASTMQKTVKRLAAVFRSRPSGRKMLDER